MSQMLPIEMHEDRLPPAAAKLKAEINEVIAAAVDRRAAAEATIRQLKEIRPTERPASWIKLRRDANRELADAIPQEIAAVRRAIDEWSGVRKTFRRSMFQELDDALQSKIAELKGALIAAGFECEGIEPEAGIAHLMGKMVERHPDVLRLSREARLAKARADEDFDSAAAEKYIAQLETILGECQEGAV